MGEAFCSNTYLRAYDAGQFHEGDAFHASRGHVIIAAGDETKSFAKNMNKCAQSETGTFGENRPWETLHHSLHAHVPDNDRVAQRVSPTEGKRERDGEKGDNTLISS